MVMFRRRATYLLLSIFILIIFYKILEPTNNEELVIPVSSKFTINSGSKLCTIHTCLDLKRCVGGTNSLSIYVQPLLIVIDEEGNRQNPEPSEDFLELRNTVQSSRHSVESFEEACLIIPGIDTLSTNRFISPSHLSRSLDSAASVFPSKPNFVVFNLFGSLSNFGDAIVISSLHLEPNFRRYFDVSIPAKLFHKYTTNNKAWNIDSIILLPLPFGSQNFNGFTNKLQALNNNVKILSKCLKDTTCIDGKEIDYDVAIKSADFVIISEDVIGFDHILVHTLQLGSIPVFASDLIVKPFAGLIDWSLISFTFSPKNSEFMVESLQKMEQNEIIKMKSLFKTVFLQHFELFPSVINSALALLEQRIIPTKVQPLAELYSPNSPPLQKPYIYASDYFIIAISHQKATSEEKLKWMLRYFLYTKTNATAILLITEMDILHIFQEYVVPSNPIQIEVLQVSSIEELPFILHDYDPYCLALIVDSSYSSINFDENIINTGFAIASAFPQRASYLISTECSEKHQCPIFYHTSLLPNNRVQLIPYKSCFSLTEPLKTSNLSWVSCPL